MRCAANVNESSKHKMNENANKRRHTLETCTECGAAGFRINSPCPLCRKAEGQDASAVASTAASLLQSAQRHEAKATGFRLGRKPPTTEAVLKARADAKDLARKEKLLFQWTVFYRTLDQNKWVDVRQLFPITLRDELQPLTASFQTSNLPEGKEFAITSPVSDIIDHITKAVHSAWASAALTNLRLEHGPLNEASPIEFAIVLPSKGVLKFNTDESWNKPLKDLLPWLSDHLKWSKGKEDRQVHLRAFVRVQPDESEASPAEEVAPKTRATRKRKNRSIDSAEEIVEIPKAAFKRVSKGSAASSSVFSASNVFSMFDSTDVPETRFFTKTTVGFELEGGKYEEKLVAHTVSEKLILFEEEKKMGGFKGCFPGRYADRRVAVCVAEGMYGFNYDEVDNKRFLFSEARALSIGRCLSARFFEELELMVKRRELTRGEISHRFMFNDGFIADFGDDALLTTSNMRDTKKKAARRYALVSPMLSNWPKPFVKFAGARAEFKIEYDKESMEWNLSKEAFDGLRKLLEVFVHYSWVQSEQAFLFADLQGAWSRDKHAFILADPQLHTSTNDGQNLAPIASWDSKTEGITTYFASHKCGRICDYLNLTEVRYVDRPRRSSALEMILNEANHSPKAKGKNKQ
ncbi:hypothetical protein FRB90_002536 [Tulasnella sp. 427]|nr:hypothetical protein FRB90_002536 [Tulasnella sp. 427]